MFSLFGRNLHHQHIAVGQDVWNELFALLASARETYLRDVIDSGKLYHRFVDDFINSLRYIDCNSVLCRNCHEMIIHIVRGILHDCQDCVRKKFATESFLRMMPDGSHEILYLHRSRSVVLADKGEIIFRKRYSIHMYLLNFKK